MIQGWYSESLFKDIRMGLKIKSYLYKGSSEFQNIEIIDTYCFGRVLVLDGVTQTTEKDEFIYHEMLTHIPMISHLNPRCILIIGGGDGGILREVIKYPIKQVYVVEIDKKVIDLSKKYLSKICQDAFKDKRTRVVIDDGAKFLKRYKNYFDIIIIDSPDPIGPARILFQSTFYKDIFKALTKEGIMVRQAGSSFFQPKILKNAYKKINEFFPIVNIYGINVPTYVGGIFNIVFASKKTEPQSVNFKNVVSKYRKFLHDVKYYNPKIHFCSFTLPNYIMN